MKARRVALALGTALVGLTLGSGSAWAYFSTTGHGTGNASTGRLSVQVLPAAGPTAVGLLPGGSGDAVLRLHNPQAIPITLVSVVSAGEPVADNGCGPTGVSFLDQSQLNVLIPAGASEVIPLPGAVTMSRAAAANCQGTGFDIPVTVTVRS